MCVFIPSPWPEPVLTFVREKKVREGGRCYKVAIIIIAGIG